MPYSLNGPSLTLRPEFITPVAQRMFKRNGVMLLAGIVTFPDGTLVREQDKFTRYYTDETTFFSYSSEEKTLFYGKG